MAYKGRPLSKEFPFSGLYGRVGNLLFHEYEKGGKFIISDYKGTLKSASRSILGCINEQKTSCFSDILIFYKTYMKNGAPFLWKNGIEKVRDRNSVRSLPVYNFIECPSPSPRPRWVELRGNLCPVLFSLVNSRVFFCRRFLHQRLICIS